MKTIGYADRANPSIIKIYTPKTLAQGSLFQPHIKRHERIIAGLAELKHTGNINIYLIKGNLQRRIASHPM